MIDRLRCSRRGGAVRVCVLALFLTGPVQASEPLGNEQVRALVAGKTVYGQNIYWQKKAMTWFFHESGVIKKRDEHGNFGKGKWRIDDKGKLCTEFKLVKETCLTVTLRPDGGYDLHADDGVHHWSFDRFAVGNREKL